MRKRTCIGLFLLLAAISTAGHSQQSWKARIYGNDQEAVICIDAEGLLFNGQTEKQRGTAFFLNNEGWAITNSHVALDANNYRKLTIRGAIRPRTSDLPMELDFKVMARDVKRDLAILKTDRSAATSFVHIAKRGSVSMGDDLMIIGCPLGFGPTINTATASNLRDHPEGRWILESNTNPGNSGGPVYNVAGNVVGIVSGGLEKAILDMGGDTPIVVAVKALGTVIPFPIAEDTIIRETSVRYVAAADAGANPLALVTPIDVASVLKALETKGNVTNKGSRLGMLDRNTLGITASPGYRFSNVKPALGADVVKSIAFSSDKKLATVELQRDARTTIGKYASGSQQLFANQSKIVTVPDEINRLYEISQINVAKDGVSKRTYSKTLDVEPGYRIISAEFLDSVAQNSTKPLITVADDKKSVKIEFTLTSRSFPERAIGWLAGSLMTIQRKAK